MFADHHQFPCLVVTFHQLGDDAIAGLFMIGLVADRDCHANGILNEDRPGEPKALISIGHGYFVECISGKPDGDAEDERAMGDAPAEWLGFAPLLIHVMGEKITGLAGMHDDVRLRYGTTVCLADLPGLELLKILPDVHGRPRTVDGLPDHAVTKDLATTFK